jgi:hypothetical protein
VLVDGVDRVGARRVVRGGQHVGLAARADDVRRVAAAGALGVVRVDRAALERGQRVLEEARLVERVGVDGHLHVERVGHGKAGADGVGRRAPRLVELDHPSAVGPAAGARTTVREGADATLRLIADPALQDLTGRYFEGTREAEPDPQARDPRARKALRELSERLTGAGQGRTCPPRRCGSARDGGLPHDPRLQRQPLRWVVGRKGPVTTALRTHPHPGGVCATAPPGGSAPRERLPRPGRGLRRPEPRRRTQQRPPAPPRGSGVTAPGVAIARLARLGPQETAKARRRSPRCRSVPSTVSTSQAS